MQKFGKSQSTKRVEDVRFLKGTGRYIDDITPDGALFAHFLRTPVAHGRITELDVDDAREMPGVVLVLTIDDLAGTGLEKGLPGSVVANADGSRAADPVRPMLADGIVRHMGEPVVMIVAETIAEAKDAEEAIMLDIDDLPVHTALAPGGPQLHAEAPDNIAFHFAHGDVAAAQAAIEGAAHRVEVEVVDNRIISNAMEPRGVYAEMEGDRLHVAINGQGVWDPKRQLSRLLKIAPEDLRVTNPDVGGSFGTKGMHYHENFLVAHATRLLGRPVRWMSERTEAMLTENAGRDLVTTATLGFDADFKLVGYLADTIMNMGAYNSTFAQHIQTELFSKVLTGTYDVQSAAMRTRGIYTNTTPVDAYRGAGRPEAIFVLERAIDEAAHQLRVDPYELRRKSFIRPDQFPYRTVADVTYDVGEFAALLDKAMKDADVAGFADRKAASAKAGKLRGQGLCYYIESILGDPDETTRIDFNADGTASIFVGTQSFGQGHETVYAKYLEDISGIPMDKVRIVQGDSDLIAKGGGTGGSRSVTVQNTATLATVDVIVAAFAAFLAEQEGVNADDISFDDETFRIAGTNLTPTMLELADMARSAGRTELLSHSKTITLESRSFPNGAHIAEVEIDPETGVSKLDRYTVVDDFGNLINPMLVAGQVHGGVAQGVGQAMCEHVVFDDEGQLLTASFMDYAMPRADLLPQIAFDTRGVPSVYNPLGMKGCGEAGTVGALAAISNAMHDALRDAGVDRMDMPYTPLRVWEALQGKS